MKAHLFAFAMAAGFAATASAQVAAPAAEKKDDKPKWDVAAPRPHAPGRPSMSMKARG